MIREIDATVTNVEDLKKMFRMVGDKVYGYEISEYGDDQIIYDLNEEVFEESIKYETPKSVSDIAEEAFKYVNEHRQPFVEILPYYVDGVHVSEHEEAVVFNYDGEFNIVSITPIWVPKINWR